MARKIAVEIAADASSLVRAFKVAEKSASKFNRDISRMTRGVAAGSGVFKGFGRSLAFASTGFLAFASVSTFLRGSVDAAREAGVAQRSLAAQMKASGESFQTNRAEIEKVALSYGKFGFQNDEVIASLTVLERGTGNINKAIRLQGLTADLARAKNIGLADAATVVAKVFGGQETALRRAVPGLEKNAHGWDLLRQAQQKLAGQAAANTTVSERFASTLHDTQEIIGAALLPTLDKYLTRFSEWLDKMNTSGRLQERVNQIVGDASGFLTNLKKAVDDVVGALGGWQNTLTILIGVWAGFKAAGIAASVAVSVANVIAAGITEKAWQAALISTGWGILAVAAGVAAAEVITHWETVKLWFIDFWLWLQETGDRAFLKIVEPFSHLPGFLGKWARDAKDAVTQDLGLIGQAAVEAAAKAAAAGKKAGAAAKAIPSVPDLSGTLDGGAAGRGGPSRAARVTRRNQWFDAMIGRREDRVQDAPLKAQIGILHHIFDLIGQRIAVTTDITRRLNLEGKQREIVRRANQIQQQLRDNWKQAEEKRRADFQAMQDKARQTKMDWLDFGLEKAQATKGIGDDIAAEKKIIAALKEQIRQTGITVDKVRELFRHRQALADLFKQKKAATPAFGSLGQAGFQFGGLAPGVLPAMLRPAPAAAFAGAAAGGPSQLAVGTMNVHLHGVQDVKALELELQKRAGQRPHPRRGN